MANKQIDMRKIKQIFKLYSEGISKRTHNPFLSKVILLLLKKGYNCFLNL